MKKFIFIAVLVMVLLLWFIGDAEMGVKRPISYDITQLNKRIRNLERLIEKLQKQGINNNTESETMTQDKFALSLSSSEIEQVEETAKIQMSDKGVMQLYDLSSPGEVVGVATGIPTGIYTGTNISCNAGEETVIQQINITTTVDNQKVLVTYSGTVSNGSSSAQIYVLKLYRDATALNPEGAYIKLAAFDNSGYRLPHSESYVDFIQQAGTYTYYVKILPIGTGYTMEVWRRSLMVLTLTSN